MGNNNSSSSSSSSAEELLRIASSINSKSVLTGKNAIIFGGTSGIGEAIALKLASRGCDVTIVGRDEQSGKNVVNILERVNPRGKHAFVKSDLVLLKNCKKVCDDYIASHDRLNYVVYCQTKSTMRSRTPTSEGIDEKLCLNFYSRLYLTNLLLPLLRKTAENDNSTADVRVMSVFAAGTHSTGYPLYRQDPRLEKSENYTFENSANLAVFYNDLIFDKFAKMELVEEMKEKEARSSINNNNKTRRNLITFIHSYPGFTNTNLGREMNFALRGVLRAMQATAAREPSVSAEFMCSGLLDPAYKNRAENPSAVLLSEYGVNDAKKTPLHTDEAMEYVWNDANKLLSEVEKKFNRSNVYSIEPKAQ